MILDIFAQNAHSQEGKAQVELAQLRYRLPRLRGKGTRAVAAGRRHVGGRARIGTRGPGETQLEVDRRRIQRRIHKLEARAARASTSTAPPSARPSTAAGSRRSRIVGYTNAGKSTLLNRLTDAGRARRGPAVRHARRDDPPPRPARRRDGAAHRHRRLHPQAAPPARRGLQVDARGGGRRRPARPRRRRHRRPTPTGNIDAVRDRARARSAPTTSPSCSRSTRPTSRPARPPRLAKRARGLGGHLGAATGEGIDELLRDHRRPAAGRSPTSSSCSSRTTAATCWPRSTARARCWPRSRGRGRACACRARLDERRRQSAARSRDVTWPCRALTMTEPGLRPAAVPVRPARRAARRGRRRCPAGCVDLSIGTPCDPPPAGRGRRRSAASGAERGYPPSIGTPAYREAAAGWMARRLGVDRRPAHGRRVHRHQGARGRHARSGCGCARPTATPCCTRRSATRPTRWARRSPAAGPCPYRRRSTDIDPTHDAARGPCASGSTRRATPPATLADLGAAAAVGPGPRRARALRRVLRRVHLGRARRARSSSTGPTACSPSTRCRSARTWPASGPASTPATPSSCTTCREVRKHAGLMVPGPVQAAAVAACGDDAHVDEQRARYRRAARR